MNNLHVLALCFATVSLVSNCPAAFFCSWLVVRLGGLFCPSSLAFLYSWSVQALCNTLPLFSAAPLFDQRTYHHQALECKFLPKPEQILSLSITVKLVIFFGVAYHPSQAQSDVFKQNINPVCLNSAIMFISKSLGQVSIDLKTKKSNLKIQKD